MITTGKHKHKIYYIILELLHSYYCRLWHQMQTKFPRIQYILLQEIKIAIYNAGL